MIAPLINTQDIPSKNDTIIIDARSGPDAYSRYLQSHLEGAFHVDLERDLSEKPKDPAYGGRHPLPPIKSFVALLGNLGITPSTRVIAYDDKSGANAAARFWWMLRALGHERVQVVNGGLDALVRAGLPMTEKKPEAKRASPYPANAWNLPTVTIDDVGAAAADPDSLVIDVREAYRYRGEREPIDLVAGHIPGAINIPYLNNLSEDGTFRSDEQLAELYKEALDKRDPKNVIVHCGSGVTACHTLLALEEAGIKGANLYVGSWSEWSRRDLPIGTGDQ
ncbi:sulfurtransferase [Chryseolinea sp. H1M3-3]|uniref:sulfurtransferase n=1 Tax=Chryseolinea sp. H1M3-3 TaxID=3034144 RepID=UPI0023ECEE9C|nr:sulfurtransferase [Chryseolinea sp. H1M3-3]